MAGKARKTEHNGPKKGSGAYWGRKSDAKLESNKRRRAVGKRDIESYDEKIKSKLKFTDAIQWRPCPSGQHWRKAHFQSTYRTRSGKVVRGHNVRAGCCDNPSKKDQIYSEELKIIAKKFPSLQGPPPADNLGFGTKGNRYDELIRGWTRFWNDILSSKDPLDANLVKALIATESGFVRDPGGTSAMGLMQVDEVARKALAGAKNELKDHLVHIDQEDILDTVLNIAAGTRWLYQKKFLAGVRLGRVATWDEAVAEYKSYLKDMIKDPSYLPRPMKDFRTYYKRLNK